SWPGPGSCARSPATPPGRSRTTASPRKAGGGAGNSSMAPPPQHDRPGRISPCPPSRSRPRPLPCSASTLSGMASVSMIATARPTGSWPGPGSCTRSPATPPGRSRTTASPRKAGGAARNSSVAPPPLAIPVPDRPRQLPRRRGDRQLRIRRPLHGLVVGIAAALLVFVGDHAVHAGAQPRLLPGRIGLPPQWGLHVRVEYPGVELDAAPGAEAPAGLVEGIERAPGDVVLMVAQADPLQGDAELFHPHGGILVQLVPPLKNSHGISSRSRSLILARGRLYSS